MQIYTFRKISRKELLAKFKTFTDDFFINMFSEPCKKTEEHRNHPSMYFNVQIDDETI